MNSASPERHAPVSHPTVGDVRESAERLLGNEFATIWADVCHQAGVADEPAAVDLDADAFGRLLDALAGKGSTSRVIAMSWKIRRTAALKLAELGR